MILMGFYSDLMGFYSDLMGFYSDQMGFYSDQMGFYSDLMGFYSDRMGFDRNLIAGCWFFAYPSEKYELIGMIVPNLWKNSKCSKPPITVYY